jgi:hypothetical protein
MGQAIRDEESWATSRHAKRTENIFNGIKTLKVKFNKVCFKNSKVVSMEIPQDVSDKGFLLSMENYQINVHSNTSKNAVMIFHENGKLDHITNVKTFVKANGCSGPYRFDDSKVSNPGPVLFSHEDESPIGFEFPALWSSLDAPPQKKILSLHIICLCYFITAT